MTCMPNHERTSHVSLHRHICRMKANGTAWRAADPTTLLLADALGFLVHRSYGYFPCNLDLAEKLAAMGDNPYFTFEWWVPEEWANGKLWEIIMTPAGLEMLATFVDEFDNLCAQQWVNVITSRAFMYELRGDWW